MKRSTDRILTTHMGSLPRPDMLADLLVAEAEGKPVDAARIPALTDEAMDYIVRRQLGCGIDVGNDGEMPRSTFFGYITGRMSGFGGQSKRRADPRHATLSQVVAELSGARCAPAERLRLPGRDRPGALREP